MNAKPIDAYEYVGVIAPGAVVAIGLLLQWPSLVSTFTSKELSLGALGVFLICAFVLGHLVQAVGNLVEMVVYAPFGGMPTERALRGTSSLISENQRTRVLEKVFGAGPTADAVAQTKRWSSIVREIYAEIAAAGHATRIDAFNRNYGLLRGIAASLALLLGWALATHWGDWRIAGAVIALLLMALYRMNRFANCYARELLVEYARAPAQASNNALTVDPACPPNPVEN